MELHVAIRIVDRTADQVKQVGILAVF